MSPRRVEELVSTASAAISYLQEWVETQLDLMTEYAEGNDRDA